MPNPHKGGDYENQVINSQKIAENKEGQGNVENDPVMVQSQGPLPFQVSPDNVVIAGNNQIQLED